MKALVSVIMCTCNRKDLLYRFSESLFAQNRLPDQYVIIDSSDEPVCDDVNYDGAIVSECRSKGIELMYRHSERGLTLQRNIGISLAVGDLLFFFDDDIVLSPNYMEILIDDMDNYPEYMGGMGKISSFDRNTFVRRCLNTIKRICLLQHSYGNGRFYPSGWAASPHGRDRFLTVEVLSGGLTVYRRKVFDEFVFDEYYAKSGPLEDADFSRRVSFKYKLFYDPRAVCQHLHVGGRRVVGQELFRNISKNYIYFFFKNYYSRNKLYIIPFVFSFPFFVFSSLRGSAITGKLLGVKDYFNGEHCLK